jgi:hypothetical protein
VSRKVDLTKPLSDEDRQYLTDRGRLNDIAVADANARGEDSAPVAQTTPAGVSGVSVGGGSPLATDPSHGRFAPAEPALQTGDGLKEGDDKDLAAAEAISNGDYDAKGVTVAHLQAEIDRRNEDRDEDDELPRSGTKQELIDRLTEDDKS